MKLRHLLPVLFLLVVSLPSITFRRHLFLPPPPPSGPRSSSSSSSSSSQSEPHAGDDDDALLRRLAAVDVGGAQVLAKAAELLANATLSSSYPSPSNDDDHRRVLDLRLPRHSSGNGNATASSSSRLRVPYGDAVPDDGSLLAAFRASLRSFLVAHQRSRLLGDADVAGVMGDLAGLLLGRLRRGRQRKFPTCAVVGNSGILRGSGRGAQIDAHDFVVRLNNAPAAAGFAPDVGARTSLAFAHSFVLHRCAAAGTPGCAACHPYGRAVPLARLAVYVSHPAHLLDAVVCGATATPASPFPLLLTDARLDALCARIAKYYSMRRFVAATGEPATNWGKRRNDGGDERTCFHYSSGLQALVLALGVCDEVSMFGFGKAAGAKHHYHTDRKKETDVHDYEAEYQFHRDLQERPETVPFLGEAPGFKVPPVKQYW